nr:RNA polymerase sigma factor [uncultured Psychroserpens sp.]
MIKLNDLVMQFQNKDEKAFEKLYHMYSKSIHGILFNIVKDQSIADELVQDTFMKAWKNAKTYSAEKGRFYTWILNIARNTAIDKLRSKSFKNTKRNFSPDWFENMITSHDDMEESTNSIGITKFLPKLSVKRCEIINLLFIEGFTQKEASKHLNIPIGTVKTRSRNGILQLRQMVL